MSLSLSLLAPRWAQPHGPCWDACQKEYQQCVKSQDALRPEDRPHGVALCVKYRQQCENKCPQYGH
jgi:hypothetical protein